jgi:xanthine dehydrogenase YagS FAD-binding subunit
VLHHSCVTWPLPAAIFFNVHVAFTSATQPTPAISESQALVVQPSAATTACLRSSAQARTASQPTDQNVALTALEATIQIQGLKGKRSIPIHDFYLIPGSTPNRENVLEPGEIITSVTLPPPIAGANSTYLKLRDRAAYEFALASAAIVMQVSGGKMQHIRVALGGVGTKPWRSFEAEKALEGHAPDRVTFVKAAEAALRDAKPASENAFKVELSRRCIVRALTMSTKSA